MSLSSDMGNSVLAPATNCPGLNRCPKNVLMSSLAVQYIIYFHEIDVQRAVGAVADEDHARRGSHVQLQAEIVGRRFPDLPFLPLFHVLLGACGLCLRFCLLGHDHLFNLPLAAR
eukprot:scaffold12645_cov76-Cyclotella_meneghiniana.AAC.2